MQRKLYCLVYTYADSSLKMLGQQDGGETLTKH